VTVMAPTQLELGCSKVGHTIQLPVKFKPDGGGDLMANYGTVFDN